MDLFTTERLLLEPVKLIDARFIRELVNTAAWLRFIGDRKVNSIADAEAYVQKMIDNPAINYWIVRSKTEETCIGTISLIKRDYLPYHDIGFAFLPAYGKKGYAYEAAVTVLQTFLKEPAFRTIMASAAPDNINSIQLMEKLGLTFKENIEVDNKNLVLYQITADKNSDPVTKAG